MSAKRTILLVRHGLTGYNVSGSEGRFLGSSDPPLAESGIEEAKALRETLAGLLAGRIYTSPARRCVQTAEIIADGRVPVVSDDLMKEIDYGEWDGLSSAEISARFGNSWSQFQEDPTSYLPPGGESPDHCAGRAKRWLARCDGRLTIGVADKTWMRLLLCVVLGIPVNRYRSAFDVKIASAIALVSDGEHWRLDALNYAARISRIVGVF